MGCEPNAHRRPGIEACALFDARTRAVMRVSLRSLKAASAVARGGTPERPSCAPPGVVHIAHRMASGPRLTLFPDSGEQIARSEVVWARASIPLPRIRA
jgi:hypothetical protein